MNVPKIVLTGGPCAGKTTALPYLVEKLSNVGFYPIVVPEAATLLINCGIKPAPEFISLNFFQKKAFELALFLEKTAEETAHTVQHPKPLIICDRGLRDILAYSGEELFLSLLKENGLSTSDACDSRYTGIFHLRTAALGAEKFYTTENNTARHETIEEARVRDAATLQAWTGHSHLRIVSNNEGTSFEGKLRSLFSNVCRLLGIPIPLEIERKFLVRPIDIERIPHPRQEVLIEQRYLFSPEDREELRIRKRTWLGSSTYYETIKRLTDMPGGRIETERVITPRELCVETAVR